MNIQLRTSGNINLHDEQYDQFISLLPREIDAIAALQPREGDSRQAIIERLAALVEVQGIVENPFFDEAFSTALCRSTAALMGRQCQGDDDREHYAFADKLCSDVILHVYNARRAGAQLPPLKPEDLDKEGGV